MKKLKMTDLSFKQIDPLEFNKRKKEIWRMIFGGDLYEYTNELYENALYKKAYDCIQNIEESRRFPMAIVIRNGTTGVKKYFWISKEGRDSDRSQRKCHHNKIKREELSK